MLEIRSGFDFSHEPVGAEDGREFGSQHFHGDLALVLYVLGEIDRCHTTLTEFALDGVAIGEGGS